MGGVARTRTEQFRRERAGNQKFNNRNEGVARSCERMLIPSKKRVTTHNKYIYLLIFT